MTDRFQRHELIPGWRQTRLAEATVVVMGVGALGNEVARLLAMTGVGKLVLCDPDRVEVSNLSRTVLFTETEVGAYKTEAARQALQRLAPTTRVDSRPRALVNGVGLAELREASLVMSCLDSRAARLQLAGRCNLVRAPHLDAGTDPWGGEIRIFTDPEGPCYGCGLTPEQRAVSDAPWSCQDSGPAAPEGAAAPSSALVGAWMALLATRFLMELSCPTGAVGIQAHLAMCRPVRLRRDPACPLHRPLGEARRLRVNHRGTVGELRAELPSGAVPLAWSPVQCRADCRRCGSQDAKWGVPTLEHCPHCGGPLQPKTVLELDHAPDHACLESLGVAPREVLAVRVEGGIENVELAP